VDVFSLGGNLIDVSFGEYPVRRGLPESRTGVVDLLDVVSPLPEVFFTPVAPTKEQVLKGSIAAKPVHPSFSLETGENGPGIAAQMKNRYAEIGD
jgi:hypothetical protein